MIKKIILAAICLALCVMYLPETARGFDEIYECSGQLLEQYPNLEAIKKQFGAEAKWEKSSMPSPHDPNLELQINSMEHPGMAIRTMGYTVDGEDRFLILLADVKKAGLVKFLEIDIGSSKEDVIKNFGEPQAIEGNQLIYQDEAEFCLITFTVENNAVVEMRFNSYPD
ncbi:MAG: hypothetical protein FWG09_05205 [Synergistaceae bacterium]|nr:hypothetical protein [Synergistaceae bacterium]